MPVQIIEGDSPLIITLPHAATEIPHAVMQRLNETGRQLTDTDWHVDRLFDGLLEDVTIVRANFHRYLCNANGDPAHLGPASAMRADTIVPLCNLRGELIWNDPPDQLEMARWRSAFHAPYHAAIAAQIARVRAQYGHALLIDCHAVRSDLAEPYEPNLPDIGIRTNKGAACDHTLTAYLAGLFMAAPGYVTSIREGAKGGWTIGKYGRPKRKIHALQIELALSTYLAAEGDPWAFDAQKADRLRNLLYEVLASAQGWHPRARFVQV